MKEKKARNDKIIKLHKKGLNICQLARLFKLSRTRIYQLIKLSTPLINHQKHKAKELFEVKCLKKEQKAYVLNKFNNECQLCFSKDKLDIHHMDRNRENNNLNNLIVICKKCHWKLHSFTPVDK